MSAFHDIILAGAAGQQGYKISRSVRLRSSASASLSRTPSSTGNRKTWTWSGWVKRSATGATNILFTAASDTSNSNLYELRYISDGGASGIVESLQLSGPVGYIKGSAQYRDPSAWYHVVCATDTTQAVQADRCKIYVNGVIMPIASNNLYSLNEDTSFNVSGYPMRMGNRISSSTLNFDGYLTEVNFIDGQALTPSSFGENDAATGVWKPKKYTGTYGTNGFYLNFSDNSAATAAAIGKDYSGNGNNWTPNNISVTAGATYDSMLDTPTPYADGGNGRGNYAVLNPLASNTATLSDGNLSFVTASTTSTPNTIGTLAVNSGKWYWEVVATSNGNYGFYGIKSADITSYTSSYVAYYGGDGNVFVGPTAVSTNSSFTNNDVIGIALDADAKTVRFYKNNVAQGTSATSYSSLTSDLVTPYVIDGASSFSTTGSVNFGQRPFAYTPPTGFKALNTQNLPDSTIKNGAGYMAATTYSGQNTSLSVSNSVNGVSFQPDFVWIKKRSGATDHNLTDSVRGTNKNLISNSTAAEDTTARLTSFDSGGFTLAGAYDNTNLSGSTYVGWQWKKGATQGFDIVTYTGTGVANRTVAHNLGVTPSMIIVKARNSSTYAWNSWHKSLSSGYYIQLNTTAAQDNSVSIFPAGGVNSSNWNTGGDPVYNNGSGTTYVAYLFAEVSGFSKFGSYTGNGSADGTFVYCGFRPRFILAKASSGIADWVIVDTARDTYNGMQNQLFPDTSGAESSGTIRFDALSNGFKLRVASDPNNSGVTYIYAAFAENPFKNSLAR